MADPAYIVDGVLTDGEAWVGVASHDFTGSETSLTLTSTDDGQVGDFSQYMDLVAIAYVRFSSGGSADGTLICEPNSDTYTGSNYESQRFDGDGSSVTAAGWGGYIFVGIGMPAQTATANAYGAGILHLFDINSGKYKSAVSQNASDRDGAGKAGIGAATWLNQGPITSLKFRASNDYTFAAGSRIDLFGVLPRMVA